MNKLPEEVAQIPKADTPATLPSISQIAFRASWGIPYDELAEEEKTQAWLTDGAAWNAGTTWKWLVLSPYLFLGCSWRTAVMGNCPRGMCLEECTWLFILPRRINDQSYESRPINGLWPIIWLVHGQGLGRNIIRKFITRKTEKEINTALSEWTKIVKTFVSFLNAHQGWPQQRMILIIQWIGRSMGTCQSLSPAVLVIPNGPS